MDIMDTARLNIKRHRTLKGLRQQDMADRLHINIRSYQSLENGETRLDLERLEQIAKELDTPLEELLRQDGIFIHQEIKEAGSGTGPGNIYHQGIEKEVLDKLLASKDSEIQRLMDEIKYLKEKIDQLLSK
jgi:transcriptional regulator with XRE-family HTH domain